MLPSAITMKVQHQTHPTNTRVADAIAFPQSNMKATNKDSIPNKLGDETNHTTNSANMCYDNNNMTSYASHELTSNDDASVPIQANINAANKDSTPDG